MKWDSIPEKPGIYIIRLGHAIRRIARNDPMGTLYIGKSLRIRNRLNQFWNCTHPASGFLWKHRKTASMISGSRIQSDNDVVQFIERMTVRLVTPLSKQFVDDAERAVLHEYLFLFGELPPLNNSLPRRWSSIPSKGDLEWAKKGIKLNK